MDYSPYITKRKTPVFSMCSVCQEDQNLTHNLFLQQDACCEPCAAIMYGAEKLLLACGYRIPTVKDKREPDPKTKEKGDWTKEGEGWKDQ